MYLTFLTSVAEELLDSYFGLVDDVVSNILPFSRVFLHLSQSHVICDPAVVRSLTFLDEGILFTGVSQ